MSTATCQLAAELIERPSVTPDDAGCQQIIAQRLAECGFTTHDFSCEDVTNSWMRRGDKAPLFVFAGHTDVVPPGDGWQTPPFEAVRRDGMLYGRGAADMKGAVAAMVAAAEEFVAAHPRHRGSLAFLLTSNEEGVTHHGTRHVVERLQARNETIDWCIVGEPSSSEVPGDTVRHGRRGSLSALLTVKGKQGHVAYAQLANNPIHAVAPVLAELCRRVWDRGNAEFPPTGFQVCNLNAGVGADNVIPGRLKMQFNFRYSSELNEAAIRGKVTEVLDAAGLDYEIEWQPSAEPFICSSGELHDVVRGVIKEVNGKEPEFSTGGGTSDARFIAPTGVQVLELGPVNKTVHMANECVGIAELERLVQMYRRILEKLLLE